MNGIIDSMDMNLSKLQETVKDREAWRAAVLKAVKPFAQMDDGNACWLAFPSITD